MTTNPTKPEVMVTFDLEDWYQLVGREFHFTPSRADSARLQVQVDRILEMLAAVRATATFFVLGWTARQHPNVVAAISQQGHDIASHGYSHRPVRSLTPRELEDDLDASTDVIGSITGSRPLGYRAPAFSIDRSTFWAYDVLIDKGFTYDSSIYPFRGRRYGIHDFATDTCFVPAPSGRSLLEIPLTVLDLRIGRVPLAGGGYWRVLPRWATSSAIQSVASKRVPMLYFHPAEFDPQRLRVPLLAPRAWPFALAQELGRRSVHRKLKQFLLSNSCISVSSYLAHRATQTPATANAA